MARRLLVTACISGGLVLIGIGVWGAVANLDSADKIASVLGAAVGVAGLGLSGYGVFLARRGPAGGQSVTDSSVGGRLVQARNVRGGLRIGPATVAPPRDMAATTGAPDAPAVSPPIPSKAAAEPGGQSVTRSRIAGPVHQVDGVGGDADLDS